MSGAGRLAGRVALITGASRGIGAAVAVAYAREGAQVILVGRNKKGLETTDDAVRAAGGHEATLVPMDITDFTQIEKLAVAVATRFGKLDILVGNAAILGELSPVTHIAPDDWNNVMATNLTANWQLLRCFEALLNVSGKGRGIFVTSGVTKRPSAYWGTYAVSKAALESMVRIYAAENQQSTIKVNLLDPGGVRTRMRAQAFPGEDPETLPAPDDITELFIKLAEPTCTETGQTFYVRG